MDTLFPPDATETAAAEAPLEPIRVPALGELLKHIDAFLERHPEITPTRFGIDASGEGSLIKTMRDGRQPSLAKARRIVAYMAEQDQSSSHAGDDAPAPAPASPNNGGGIIPSFAGSDREDGHGHPFPPSSPISSATRERRRQPAASQACSDGEADRA